MSSVTSTYSAVMVTFHRPVELRRALTAVTRQDLPPAFVVVADNDPAGSAAAVIDGGGWPVPVIHLPMLRNLGPAGGWAAATAVASARPDRGEWVLVLDDDDPIAHPAVVRQLLDRARAYRLAAIGLRGAELHGPFGLLRRVTAATGVPAPADYLASNGAPLYRWAAIDDVGGFDDALFFGFEDLDLGLRLARAGWTMRAVELDELHVVADTSPARTPWREYYKTRALVVIARRHLGLLTTALTVGRAAGLGAVRLLPSPGGPGLARARVQGALDGLRARLGVRRYDPSANPAKGLRG